MSGGAAEKLSKDGMWEVGQRDAVECARGSGLRSCGHGGGAAGRMG